MFDQKYIAKSTSKASALLRLAPSDIVIYLELTLHEKSLVQKFTAIIDAEKHSEGLFMFFICEIINLQEKPRHPHFFAAFNYSVGTFMHLSSIIN